MVGFRGDLRGLIVDWGGVLTSSIDESTRSWAYAHDVDHDHYVVVMEEWFGLSYGEQSRAHPIVALERGELEVPDFEVELAQRLRTRDGAPVVAEGLLARIFEHFMRAPDMHRVVLQAKRAGLRTALLSNSWGNNYPRQGWDEMFDAVVISGEVGMRKPEPEIFRYAASELRLSPDRCVFVDDLVVNVHAAGEVGMVGVHHASYHETAGALEALFGVPFRDGSRPGRAQRHGSL